VAQAPEPADFLPLPADALFILLALAAEPLHGYGIMRDVEQRSEGKVLIQTGALYRMLRRLLAQGLIQECDRPAQAASDDERRRYYQPTLLGRQVLDADVARMARIVRAARLTAEGKRPRLV